MQVIRFYSMTGTAMEGLAKYLSENDVAREKVELLCLGVAERLPEGQDPYAVINKRFVDLELELSNIGFTRVPMATAENFDSRASTTFDVVIDPEKITSTVITFMIQPNPDGDGGVEKKMISKRISSNILH